MSGAVAVASPTNLFYSLHNLGENTLRLTKANLFYLVGTSEFDQSYKRAEI